MNEHTPRDFPHKLFFQNFYALPRREGSGTPAPPEPVRRKPFSSRAHSRLTAQKTVRASSEAPRTPRGLPAARAKKPAYPVPGYFFRPYRLRFFLVAEVREGDAPFYAVCKGHQIPSEPRGEGNFRALHGHGFPLASVGIFGLVGFEQNNLSRAVVQRTLSLKTQQPLETPGLFL